VAPFPHPLPGDGVRRPAGERDRLIAAISKAAAEHGYAGLTIERIVSYSGLDRETFDTHFDSREQGLLAAQEVFLQRLFWEATAACEGLEPWPVRLRAGLRAVLSSLLESADLARVFTVEADAAGLALVEHQIKVLDDFALLMRKGRKVYPVAGALPEVTERVLVAGVAALVRQRLLREETTAVSPLEEELTELLLLPYVGDREARRIAMGPLRP
jgi:AcrR family transcriptional regulator